ncbi:MAG: hypothetical protein C0483_17330 [Pirellula sp.]|nr:hypothetical protein [Pirellula sp.]
MYETRQFDDVVTTVLLPERPINLAKLKASLGKPAGSDDDLYEFQPQTKLVIDANERISGISIRCDNRSISGNGGGSAKPLVEFEGGRARGTSKTTESEDAIGKKYDLNGGVDASVLTSSAPGSRSSDERRFPFGAGIWFHIAPPLRATATSGGAANQAVPGLSA